MKEKSEEKITVAYHAVTFIDILGQQEQLRQLTNIPDKDSKEFAGFTEKLKAT